MLLLECLKFFIHCLTPVGKLTSNTKGRSFYNIIDNNGFIAPLLIRFGNATLRSNLHRVKIRKRNKRSSDWKNIWCRNRRRVKLILQIRS